MKGIDIIEAMGGIDPELIRDAKNQQQAVPLWLKGLATAACLFCVAGITLLSLGRLLGNTSTKGNAMSPVPPTPSPVIQPASAEEDSAEEPAISPPAQATSTPAPVVVYETDAEANGTIIYISEYGVSLRVPTRYQGEVMVVDTEYSLDNGGNTVNYGHTAFAFFDTSIVPAQDSGTSALVFLIVAAPLDAAGTNLAYGDTHSAFLGRNSEYQYFLVYREPSGQCDFTNAEEVYSYLSHMNAGLMMLEDFVSVNAIFENTEGFALDDYSEAIRTVREAWDELRAGWLTEPYGEDAVVMENLSGHSLEVPISLSENISIGSDSFTFAPPTSQSMDIIWSIQAVPWDRYYEGYGRQDTEFAVLGDGYELLGRTEEYAFVITYPTDPAGGPYMPEDTKSAVAYARYEQLGRRIIQSFLDRNGIEGNPEWTLNTAQ